jgi:hypothetical protein
MSKKNERIRTGKPGDEAEKAPMPVQMLCTQTREMRMAIFLHELQRQSPTTVSRTCPERHSSNGRTKGKVKSEVEGKKMNN